MSKQISNDTAVQGTNDSSVLSKFSTCNLGYYKDDYIKYFASKQVRRSPIINRGYYIRYKAIDETIKCFIENNGEQIISLGAGFDTVYFRWKDSPINVLEIDFPEVIRRKITCIKRIPEYYLQFEDHDRFIINEKYRLCGLDICLGSFSYNLSTLLTWSKMNKEKPTLILCEVVLPYLQSNKYKCIVKNISEIFTNVVFFTYEQLLPPDSFTTIMLNHFETIGTPLKSMISFPELDMRMELFLNILKPFDRLINCDMNNFFYNYISVDERKRINNVESFDEHEEFISKCSHYTLLISTIGSCTNIENFPGSKYIYLSNAITKHEELQVKILESGSNLQCYGHSSSIISNEKDILIFGGFGMNNLGGHSRLNFGRLFNYEKNNLKVFNGYEVVHHTMNEISANRFICFGGRKSPNKFCMPHEICVGEKREVTVDKLKCIGSENYLKKWRHASVNICINNRHGLFIYGGKRNSETLKESCILWYDNFKIEEINLQLPELHSHTLTSLSDTKLLVIGGIKSDETISNNCYFIDFEINDVKSIVGHETCRRFSHTSHRIKQILLLIGGVSTNSRLSHLSLLNLETLNVLIELNFAYSIPDSVITLHNHSSVMIEDRFIYILGGGGNYFSFGSHFNNFPMLIDLHNLLRNIDI